jgi:ubiquinone/menaquinone biosynthesis C-methylase UbiE
MHSHKHFLPAAGHDWLLPLYDPLNRLLGEERIKGPLVEQAALQPGHRILDIGCGTGSVTLLAKHRQPGADVLGLDPDPKALARARAKAERAGLDVHFEQGFASELPFEDASFDRALSSMMLHHLSPEEKAAALRELARVVVPGGSVHVLDFGPARGRLAKLLAHMIHRADEIAENLADAIPGQLRGAGFDDAAEITFRKTLIGTLCYYRGTRTRP